MRLREAERRPRRIVLDLLRHVAPFAAVTLGCTRDVARPDRELRPTDRRVVAVAVITFRNIGSPDMTASAIVAPTIEELEARFAAQTGPRASFDLTVPKNIDGSGETMIEFDVLQVKSVSTSGTRYFEATYRVRNAQRSDSIAFNTARHNLTFVAVSAARTIGQTPVLQLDRADGTPADPALTLQLKPTGAVAISPNNSLVPLSPDVLQVLTESEVAAIAPPASVTNTFPYGFMVRREGNNTTRTLDPLPPPNEFQGIATFAFRIPLQPNPVDNPTTISVLMLGLDDSQTRITQSLEEQNAAGQEAVRARAMSLNVSTIRLLPGGTIPGSPPPQTQVLCSVRTAGTASAPTAHLVNVQSSFVSLNPNPYSAAGNVVPSTSTIQATFSQNVAGVGPSNFIVRGFQSGQAFRGATYTIAGPVVTTPPGSFLPGEVLEVEITSGISCPKAWVGRLRVLVPTASSGALSFRTNATSGEKPYKVAVGDFNRDGFLDIAKANGGSHDVTIMKGDGTGSFTVLGSFPAGGSPEFVATADFNDDGILDLAVANSESNVSILLGKGDGTFGSAQSFALGGQPGQLVVGDLNGDGILDLVVSTVSTDNVAVFLGNGNGTFRPQASAPTARDPVGVSIGVSLGDVNNDGALDIVVANGGVSGNTVTLFLGNGDGTFGVGQRLAIGQKPVSLALADVNRDGLVDIITANAASADVSVRLGNGNGTFQAERTFTSGSGHPDWVAVGDMNGDGVLDLVVANATSGISVLRGVGNGTFPTHQDIATGSVDPNFLTLADLNRDGILDVVLGSERSSTFGLLLGRP